MRSERPGEAPQMKWIYGPLAKAMRDGHALVLNEVDLVEPGELSGLNDVLDGRPLVISENGGEIIYPHPDFRVFVTGNSFGSGDERGVYQGVKVQNLAAMDRYRMLEVKYLAPEIEEKIIQNVAPDLPEVIVKGMVQSANEIRHVFMGQADQGSSGLDINTQLGVTMSTRVIRRWANLTMDFSKADNALQYALDIALLRRTQPEERVAISQICKSVFGEQWSVEATQ
ncbi:MAG TPA: CbbQ/NirQ/NorQ/GpvN family protein, partial [Marinobacter sp.]|nr:CbbQ/NirQ/NorQ/GpvN family protein [Marinobacter sp.]